MFIKLTRLNGAPIWINGAYVVTVEKGRQVGSVVVPIGDGLDYDVKETPEQILEMIDGKVEAVVPVAASDALTLGETGAAVLEAAKEAEAAQAEGAKESAAVEAKVEAVEPVKSAAEEAEESAAVAVEAVKAVETAKKVARRSTVAKRAVKATKAKTTRAKKPALDLDEKQIERLIKQKPRTKKRLINTLDSQFKTASSEDTVAALIAHGVMKMDENEKIDWGEKV